MRCAYDLEPKFDKAKSFHGKALVREIDNVTELWSYDKKIAEIVVTKLDDFDVIIFNVPGVFSDKMFRHLREFLKQNGLVADTPEQIVKDYILEEV